MSNGDSKKKDGWDLLEIVGKALVPVAVAVVGWLISSSLKEAEIRSTESIANAQAEIERTRARVEQAGLVSSLLAALTVGDCDNDAQKRLAIAVVRYVMPNEEGALEILSAVREADQSPSCRQLALEVYERDIAYFDPGTADALEIMTNSTDQAAVEEAIQSILSNPRAHLSTATVIARAESNPDDTTIANNVLSLLNAPQAEVVIRRDEVLKNQLEGYQDALTDFEAASDNFGLTERLQQTLEALILEDGD
jgi:hypothetical protein